MTLEQVSIGRVKRFPAEVFSEVARNGRPVEVTSRGVSLGAMIAPVIPAKKTWLTVSELSMVSHESPLPSADTENWINQVEALRDNGEMVDPWTQNVIA